MKKAILAVLIAAGVAAGQTPIYRSVQPGVTAALSATGGTLTISGTTATFSLAQPDSVGLGDAIIYDSDGNSSIDAIAFIHGRTSSTAYTVASAAGGTPTAVAGDEDWNIFRAYTSIASVEGGTENAGIDAAVRAFDGAARNLDSNAEIFNLAVYAGTEGNGTTIDWDSWDTSATEYLNIFAPHTNSQVGVSQRNRYNTTYNFKFDLAASTDLTGHVRIEGLNFSSITQSIELEFSTSGGDYLISYCKFSSEGTNLPSNSAFLFNGLTGAGNGGCTIRVWNCFIDGFESTDGGNDGYGVWMTGNLGNQPNVYFYNNTIINCDIGYLDLYNAGLSLIKNTIIQANSDAFSSSNGISASSDYNLTNDDDARGDNSIIETTLDFVDAGSGNYHLTSADAAIAVGTDLSGDANLSFTDDFDGDARTTWNMGADEFQAEPTVSGGDFFLRRRSSR